MLRRSSSSGASSKSSDGSHGSPQLTRPASAALPPMRPDLPPPMVSEPISTYTTTSKHLSELRDSKSLPVVPQYPSRASSRLGENQNPSSASSSRFLTVHDTHNMMAETPPAGSEPGVDPRAAWTHARYTHVKERCLIEIIEYSPNDVGVQRMGNHEFLGWLAAHGGRGPVGNKKGLEVRWINVVGVSWDILSALALEYDLHPLAVEDVLQSGSVARSKADYYPNHLFVHILNHTLKQSHHHQEQEDQQQQQQKHRHHLSRSKRTGSHHPHHHRHHGRRNGNDNGDDDHNGSEDDSLSGFSSSSTSSESSTQVDSSSSSSDDEGSDNPHKLRRTGSNFLGIKRKKRSSSSKNRSDSAQPTTGGNARPDTIDPEAGAPSKRTFTSWYEKAAFSSKQRRRRAAKVAELEVLKKGNRVMVYTSNTFFFLLHDGTIISVLQRDRDFSKPILERLNHRESVLRKDPDASLLLQSCLDLIVDNALAVVERYHDKILKFERKILLRPNIDTVQDLHVMSGDLTIRKRTMTPIKSLIYGLRRYDLERTATILGDGVPVKDAKGFMSSKTKMYLADIYDHVEYILASLEMYSAMTENLINYAFNMSGYHLNEIMRIMTLVTVIFLPLTLLTGYFGMNFTSMPSVDNHSDAYFWWIAVPVMAVILPIFLWSDIRNLARYVKKRLLVGSARSRQKRRARKVRRAMQEEEKLKSSRARR